MLAAPNEEGAEFVVRSVCRIDAGKSGLQVTDAASGTPLADFPLQARCLHAKVALRTGKDGGVQKPEGVWVRWRCFQCAAFAARGRENLL